MSTPIKDCPHKDGEDGCCHHPENITPECHVHACPMISRELDAEVARLRAENAALRAVLEDAHKALTVPRVVAAYIVNHGHRKYSELESKIRAALAAGEETK